ncbi:hypothetical protein FPRO06_05112 [Fusarium proliferatum]|nr:hypothetical protein FPRO06_05112 [Fusarium proliferatum]
MAPLESRTNGESHFFYIWNPDTDWYPDFEGRQRDDPLGPNFGGYHHDLATICVRMRADRQALVETAGDNSNVVFHLIIPTYYPIVIDTPIVFAAELFPLTITGSRHRATDLVWFSLDECPNSLSPRLKFIGTLPLVRRTLREAAYVTYVGSFVGAMAWIAAVTFPPFAPVGGPVFLSCCTSAFAPKICMLLIAAQATIIHLLPQAMGQETHVAPATANSTVSAFVNKDMQQTNAAVDIIMMANLAG